MSNSDWYRAERLAEKKQVLDILTKWRNELTDPSKIKSLDRRIKGLDKHIDELFAEDEQIEEKE